MERMELAKRLFMQARKMTLGMGAAVVVYGAIGYFLIKSGHAGPLVLDAHAYGIAKYASFVVSASGIIAMWQLGARMTGISRDAVQVPLRHPQKLFVRTILLNAAAELPVLLGMILVFLGRQPFDYIPFAVLSLAGFAFAFPRKQQWASWLGADF